MKARLLIPQPVSNPEYPNGPQYIEQPAGTIIEHPKVYFLVRNGQAEPADAECKEACSAFWNDHTKAFLSAWYDQRTCGATTGSEEHDSVIGIPAAMNRIKARLDKAQEKYDANKPASILKAHLKLCNALRSKANAHLKGKDQISVLPPDQGSGDQGD